MGSSTRPSSPGIRSFPLVHHTDLGTVFLLGLFLTAVDPFVVVPILLLASWLDEPIWRAVQMPATRERLQLEAMAKKVAEAIAVDTAMICRSCRQVSHTRGESAIGRAATYTCGFCGHRTLIPLYRPETIAKARKEAGLL